MKTESGDARPEPTGESEDVAAVSGADDIDARGAETPPDEPADDRDAEPFVRYQNSVYRLISMGGAALVAIIGITMFAIGRTLDPVPPAQFFFIDAIVTILLFGWYLLGMRCRLDVAETWVHIATKYGDFRIDRDRIVSIEPDTSLRGTVQFSGRPLIVRYRTPDHDDKVKTRRAFGCLPNDAQTQVAVVEELQAALGRPDESSPEDLAAAVSDRLTGDATDAGNDDVAAAVAARLAEMEPEGDDPTA